MAAFVRHARFPLQLFQRFGRPQIQSWGRQQGLHTCCGRPMDKVLNSISARGYYVLNRSNESQSLLQRAVVFGVLPVRWNSTDDKAAPLFTEAQTFPEGYIPEPPPIPVPDVPVGLEVNILGEPTLQALGLGGGTPTGLIQSALEYLHVGLDLPWWGTIMVGTIIIRMFMFPLVAMAQKHMAKTRNHMPTITRLQEKITKERKADDLLEALQTTMELQDYLKRNDVRPMRAMMVPMIQMPIFISVFFALREMVNLPVESMKTGGLFWFTDLTVPDPFCMLSLITATTVMVTFELGADGVNVNNMTHVQKWILRGMAVSLFPISVNFSAGILCYWVTSNCCSLVQALFLRIPAVREFFNIPAQIKLTKEDTPPKKGFIQGFKETMDNSRVIAEIEDRQRMDAVRWKEAGEGPIVKTYSDDPTKGTKEKKGKKAAVPAKSK